MKTRTASLHRADVYLMAGAFADYETASGSSAFLNVGRRYDDERDEERGVGRHV